MFDGFRHLRSDTVCPTDTTTGELSEGDSTETFDSHLKVEGLLRHRKRLTIEYFLGGLDVLRVVGIELLSTKGVPRLPVPVPEHLEWTWITCVEKCYLDIAETILDLGHA